MEASAEGDGVNLVTGGLGFIGSWLVDSLVADGEPVVIVDDGRGKATYKPPAGVDVLRHDISALGSDLGRLNAVWHLASPVGPVGVIEQAGRITGQVIAGTQAAIRYAQQSDCPLILVSTSEVYGGGADGLCDELMPMLVSSWYSARGEYQTAKLAAEVMAYNTDVDVRIIRPFNVAGPRQRPEGGFVLARWKQQHLRGEPITVYEPGTQRRAMTSVFDVVEGMRVVREEGDVGIWNIGNPDNVVTMLELADLWVDQTGDEVAIVDPISLHGGAFREAPDKYPDASKAMSIGWRPQYSVSDIIEQVLLA
jgi:nucleoside-diphosphate-sugar epimerase